LAGYPKNDVFVTATVKFELVSAEDTELKLFPRADVGLAVILAVLELFPAVSVELILFPGTGVELEPLPTTDVIFELCSIELFPAAGAG
jgi:hypothetical protein